MGCICSKDWKDEQKAKKFRRPRKSSKRLVVSLRKEDLVVQVDKGANEATMLPVSTEHAAKVAGSTPASWEEGDKQLTVFERPAAQELKRWATMETALPRGKCQMSGELCAGKGIGGAHNPMWPVWLTAVAGEAIKGLTPRKLESFERLEKISELSPHVPVECPFLKPPRKPYETHTHSHIVIGQGTYSNVYRARDLETGKIVALKKVRFCNMDPESVCFMAREILILRRLDHPNVMKLEGLVTSRVSSSLYLVFEYMEHDLAGLTSSPLVKFTESQMLVLTLVLTYIFWVIDPVAVLLVICKAISLRSENNFRKLLGWVQDNMVISGEDSRNEVPPNQIRLLPLSITKKQFPAVIKCYMHQLLRGFEHCHTRGIMHRDIKGSNILIDNNGNLKIGDFGLATFFDSNQNHPLTSRVVTLWYRAPELLLGATYYGVAVDLWSAGCILAELFTRKPIMSGRTEFDVVTRHDFRVGLNKGLEIESQCHLEDFYAHEVEQLHKIYKLCGSPSEEYWNKSKLPLTAIFKPQQPYKRRVAEAFKNLPPSALALLETLLAFEPEHRGSTTSALQSEFFLTNPLPCDPSSLLKYPPSKEYDTKVRREEAKRQLAAYGKGCELESSRKGSKELKAVPAPEANAELQPSIQKVKMQPNPSKNSEKFSPEEDGGSGVPIKRFRRMGESRHSLDVIDERPHVDHTPFGTSENNELKTPRLYKPQEVASGSSKPSCSVTAHSGSQLEKTETSAALHEQEQCSNTRNKQLNNGECRQVYPENRTVCAPKQTPINYSGPLLGGSVEKMLEDHQKQIQIAVRKAQMNKNRTRKWCSDNNPAPDYISR
ncbi:putative serine/threonine-protein kinase [Sesamum angolense]|uniref:Serine/threonine-protein kinase n=1 Tax=Sesamum angolense TaxID=2727404 RepID=A0AAE1WYY1_9LAMI|nr:putative serine/threonine-protein kinase [Sesamum angolense]